MQTTWIDKLPKANRLRLSNTMSAVSFQNLKETKAIDRELSHLLKLNIETNVVASGIRTRGIESQVNLSHPSPLRYKLKW